MSCGCCDFASKVTAAPAHVVVCAAALFARHTSLTNLAVLPVANRAAAETTMCAGTERCADTSPIWRYCLSTSVTCTIEWHAGMLAERAGRLQKPVACWMLAERAQQTRKQVRHHNRPGTCAPRTQRQHALASAKPSTAANVHAMAGSMQCKCPAIRYCKHPCAPASHHQ